MTYQKGIYSSFISKKGRKGIFLNHEVRILFIHLLIPPQLRKLTASCSILIDVQAYSVYTPSLRHRRA